RALRQRVVERHDRAARIPEQQVHPLLFEQAAEDLGAGEDLAHTPQCWVESYAVASSRSACRSLLSACTRARALASTISVDAPCPESVLPPIRHWRKTCPTESRPGVTERTERLLTSTGRSRISLMAAKAAAIGPSPPARAARSP